MIRKTLDLLNTRSMSAPGEVTFADRIKGIRAAIWNWFGQIIGVIVGGLVFGHELIAGALSDPNVLDGISKLLKSTASTMGVVGVSCSLFALFVSYWAEVQRTKRNDNRGVPQKKDQSEDL